MGYTHSWSRPFNGGPDDAAWQTIRDDVLTIMQASGIPLHGPDDTAASLPGPVGGAIHFNPVDVPGETFRLQQDGGERGFCKTNELPYDVVVAAILCYLESVAGICTLAEHADPDDYVEGLELAKKALPQHADMLWLPLADEAM